MARKNKKDSRGKNEKNAKQKPKDCQREKKDRRDRTKGRKNEKISKSFDLLMKQQLMRYGLDFKDITGDGNCLFRAISDQMVGNEDLHEEYRATAMRFMRDNKSDFAPFVEDDEDFDHYVKRLSKAGTWGGNLELQALSQALEVNIKIHILGSPVWEIMNWPGNRSIHLSYHEESHYNSVRIRGDLTSETPQNIPDFADIVETSDESKAKLFEFFASYFVDTFQEGQVKQVAWALQRVYQQVPGFDEICYDYQKIVDEMSGFVDEEEKKTEDKPKMKEEKTPDRATKKPAKLPNNKEKCWCGSGRIYKKCCKPYDHLRETEEEKVVVKMNSLQI